jgi:hypothetical protein
MMSAYGSQQLGDDDSGRAQIWPEKTKTRGNVDIIKFNRSQDLLLSSGKWQTEGKGSSIDN